MPFEAPLYWPLRGREQRSSPAGGFQGISTVLWWTGIRASTLIERTDSRLHLFSITLSFGSNSHFKPHHYISGGFWTGHRTTLWVWHYGEAVEGTTLHAGVRFNDHPWKKTSAECRRECKRPLFGELCSWPFLQHSEETDTEKRAAEEQESKQGNVHGVFTPLLTPKL